MSDTKALQDVVAKALANWGNGEAQDAFEALMGRLKDAEEARDHAVDMMRSARHTLDALASLHEIGDHTYQELACHLKDEPNGNEGERIVTRAEADNAALLKALKSAREALGKAQPNIGWGTPPRLACGRAYDAAGAVVDAEHPGAALLEELEGLRIAQGAALEELRQARAQVSDLEAARDSYRDEKRSLESAKDRMLRDMADLKRKADAARDAALEEAAKVADAGMVRGTDRDKWTNGNAYSIAAGIRALKKTGQGA